MDETSLHSLINCAVFDVNFSELNIIYIFYVITLFFLLLCDFYSTYTVPICCAMLIKYKKKLYL